MKEPVIISTSYNSRPITLFEAGQNQRAALLSNKLSYRKFIKS